MGNCCKDGGRCPDQKVLNITGFADIDGFLADVFDTMAKKGHDYRQGNDSDLLHNFRTVANTVGTDMEKVWFTYFYKHYAAMCTFIKEGGQSESEPIEGRIKDQIVYLVLFWKMVQERKQAKEVTLEEALMQIEAAYDRHAPTAQSRTLKSDPNVIEVPVAGGAVEVDPQRMYKLAGGAGAFVDPEVKARAGEIHKKLEARDEESRRQESWLGRLPPQRTWGTDEAIAEAVAETLPLHEREAVAKGEAVPGSVAATAAVAEKIIEDEIQQGRAANGSFDGPVPTDIPF